jgi:hypothetical protein
VRAPSGEGGWRVTCVKRPAEAMTMRIMMLMSLMWAGCGTSDPLTWQPCAGCATAGATWSLIADGAEINGDYDPIGPPDPYICVTVGGATHCSSQQSDTSTPRWSETLATGLTTAELTTGALPVAMWDVDTGGFDSNDLICSTELTVTADNLEAGGIRFTCSSNGTTAAFLFRHLQ